MQITPKIKPHLTEEGLTAVTYQPQDEKANFFRIVFANIFRIVFSNLVPRKPDVYSLLEEIE